MTDQTPDPAQERVTKLKKLIQGFAASAEGRDALAAAMDACGLAMLQRATIEDFPACTDPRRLAEAGTGIILDGETTGLDDRTDEIIELAMLRVKFDEGGILAIEDSFDKFHQPKEPISEEITRITGITNEMVEGCEITEEEVTAFIGDSSLYVAHNAAFDRKFCENQFPNAPFATRPWHCSMAQVDWSARGMNGRSLEVLALGHGLVYGSHRADADTIATGWVLKGEGDDQPFAEMIRNGERETLHVMAKDSPFEAKDTLKERGYKWCPDGVDTHGYSKVWHREIPADDESVAAEAEFLRNEIFGKDVALPAYRIDATERYSARKPERKEMFRTAEARNLVEDFKQRDTETAPTP